MEQVAIWMPKHVLTSEEFRRLRSMYKKDMTKEDRSLYEQELRVRAHIDRINKEQAFRRQHEENVSNLKARIRDLIDDHLTHAESSQVITLVWNALSETARNFATLYGSVNNLDDAARLSGIDKKEAKKLLKSLMNAGVILPDWNKGDEDDVQFSRESSLGVGLCSFVGDLMPVDSVENDILVFDPECNSYDAHKWRVPDSTKIIDRAHIWFGSRLNSGIDVNRSNQMVIEMFEAGGHTECTAHMVGRASQMTDQQYKELLERVKDLETAYHFSRQPGNCSVGRARLLEAEERVAERVEHNK